MDRTLELPTQILHNILSRLSTKTAAQTSVLSKPWLKACSTNPHLSFNESFSNQTDSDGLVDKWLDIVAEKGVSQVALLAKSRSRLVSERYTLSAYTIFAMESLQELELNYCKVLKLKPIIFEDSKIKCRNLKSVMIGNWIVRNFTE
uniref:F-box protein At3g58860 n=1 Tax=Nicotiana tabacum TaxID=4097 RepID=A0A1S4DNX1_TOBAC|nr:PREDICTED: putative F-box protein At3g58860 [Nicotiana tabacum]